MPNFNSSFSRRSFLITGSSCVAGLLFSPALLSAKSREDDEITKLLKSDMVRHHIPGMAACVILQDGTIGWSCQLGFADIEKQIPVVADQTLFNVGSLSKTVTTIAVMREVESGRLALDADVNDYLPFEVRNPSHPAIPITPLQLLTHRSSISDGPAYMMSYACGDTQASLGTWLASYLNPDGELFDPATNFHTWEPGFSGPLPPFPPSYSNIGFGLLGHLVERTSGVDFTSYCRENIFLPLRMDRTGWRLSEVDSEKHAIPYSFLASDFEVPPGLPKEAFLPFSTSAPWPPTLDAQWKHCLYAFPTYPDGLLRTSVIEYARLLRAAINQSEPLSPESWSRIFSVAIESDPMQGVGWRRIERPTGVLWGHEGADPGINSAAWFSPDSKTGAVLFTNSSAAPAGPMCVGILEEYARRVSG